MARIRLRHCTVRFLDGFRATAKVKAATTPVNGNTSMQLDTVVAVNPATATVLPAGTRFTIAGVSRVYTITADAAINTGAATISFTPALATADHIPSAQDVVTILGRCLEVKVGDGNLTWDTAQTFEYEMDRGQIDAVVEGDDVPVDVRLDMVYEFLTAITGAGTPTPEDVLKNRGEAATWITSGADPCELYCVDIEVDYAPPCNVDHEITTLPEFRWESVSHDISQATLAASGKCKTTDVTSIRRGY